MGVRCLLTPSLHCVDAIFEYYTLILHTHYTPRKTDTPHTYAYSRSSKWNTTFRFSPFIFSYSISHFLEWTSKQLLNIFVVVIFHIFQRFSYFVWKKNCPNWELTNTVCGCVRVCLWVREKSLCNLYAFLLMCSSAKTGQLLHEFFQWKFHILWIVA